MQDMQGGLYLLSFTEMLNHFPRLEDIPTPMLSSLSLVWGREWEKRAVKWCKSRLLSFLVLKWCFSKRLASLLCGCGTVQDDNRICWECGPLLCPPRVTTWSDGNGWAAWEVDSGPPLSCRGVKTAQCLHRMWGQAIRKLGRLKGRVSPVSFLSLLSLQEGRGATPSHSDSFILSFICALAAFSNKW
jgi:hypothetical protein